MYGAQGAPTMILVFWRKIVRYGGGVLYYKCMMLSGDTMWYCARSVLRPHSIYINSCGMSCHHYPLHSIPCAPCQKPTLFFMLDPPTSICLTPTLCVHVISLVTIFMFKTCNGRGGAMLRVSYLRLV